jgi:arylsulfatase A-like enzyme
LLNFNSCKDASNEKPNILFLVIEDTSPYLLPAYGNESIKTPNLDFLSNNGVVFNNAISNGPQCSPARSSLISGSYATTYGTDWHRNSHIVPQQYFFPQYLREAGYFCVNAGKTDYNITKEVQKKFYPLVWDKMSSYLSKDTKNASYNDTDRGIKPFFAQFNNMTTHMSRITSVSLNNREASKVNPDSVILPPHVPDLPEIRADYALHLDGVADADKWVGFFLEDLKKRGLDENTIIFFFSDHGGCLPRGKAFPYATGFKSALIVYAPEKWQHLLPQTKNHKTDRLVEFTDFGPTLLSIAGVKPPEHMQGKAFMGTYKCDERDYAMAFRTNTGIHFDPSRSAFTKQYQYIKYYTPYKAHALKQSFQWGMPAQIAWDSVYHNSLCEPKYQAYFESKPNEMLFDIKKDPYCTNNLANNTDYKNKLDSMRQTVSNHIRKTKDLGFFPKEVRDSLVKAGISHYEWIRENNYPLNELYTLIEKASLGEASDESYFVAYLKHKRPEIRFWAASGLAQLAHKGYLNKVPIELENACNDKWKCVAAVSSEALIYAGQADKGILNLIHLANEGYEQAMSALENVGNMVKPYLKQIALLTDNKQSEIRFMARGILINNGALSMSKLFENKQIKSFTKNQHSRIVNWAPTLP